MPSRRLPRPDFGRKPPETASMPTDFLDYPAAIEYLFSLINYERTGDSHPYPFRLRRMRRLIDRLELGGIAGAEVPLVHIAGTKGKGSTATMVASMLTASGLKTGLYTSPHLIDIEERFRVDFRQPDQEEMVALVGELRAAADWLARSGAGSPTFFESTTAIGLMLFKRTGCQAVVLEVGLGGLLDSTNVCSPRVTAITSIGLDHQHILGDTLAEIAAQKAGILKPGVPVVSGVRDGEAADVIAQTAEQRGAPLFQLGRDFDFHLESLADGWRSRLTLTSNRPEIRPRVGWEIPLAGAHQGQNAAIACAILDLLDPTNLLTRPEDQAAGLALVRCAGRIERFLLADGCEVILDTAHNVESISALCDFLEGLSPGKSVTVIFGTSRDKPYRGMLLRLLPVANRMLLTRYLSNPRYREPPELLAALPADAPALIEDQPVKALQLARSGPIRPSDQRIVICGSFFLAAELRPLLQQAAAEGLGSA